MKVRVGFEFTPDVSSKAVGVGDGEVDLQEAPRGITLQSHSTSEDDLLHSSGDDIREMNGYQHPFCFGAYGELYGRRIGSARHRSL